MATAGFLGALADTSQRNRQRKEAEDYQTRVSLRERKADDIEKAIQGLQQRGSMQPGQPGYLSPDELKFQIGEAQKQLSGLYEPHEGPDLLKRLKKIHGKQDDGTKTAMSETPPISLGGVTLPGQKTGITLRPGMTLSEVLAAGSPASQPAPVRTEFELWKQQNPTAPVADWFKLKQNEKGDEVKTEFQLWRSQNPTAPVEDWFKLKGSEKPSKPMEADIKGSLFMGVNDPTTGKKYSRAQLEKGDAPNEAVAIYKDWKQAKAEQETGEEKKENARVDRQLRTIQASFDRGDYVAARRELNKGKADVEQAMVRQNTMDRNYAEATKNPADQQAMMSLLANHIGMTLGAQKGARITRAVWEEALSSRPWLSGANASFVKGTDGVEILRGVVLTPDQMKQMVELAHDKTDILKQNISQIETDYADDLAKGAGHEGKRGKKAKKPADDPLGIM